MSSKAAAPVILESSQWYQRFGELEARGQSAVYEEWALSVAQDLPVLALIDQLPLQKRQPNLIFACARLLGAPVGSYGPFRQWLRENWPAVAAEALVRSTQTNESRRCAALMPALALIAASANRPLALLEVGASAGLCLYPDRYSYRYNNGEILDPPAGRSSVVLDCATSGPMPDIAKLPQIVWRAGIDLNPLSVGDARDTLWLTTLMWPEQQERRERLSAAIAIVATDPPRIIRGDAVYDLAQLAAQAPDDATLVIVSAAVLVYMTATKRVRFVEVVRATGARWVSLEGAGGLPGVASRLPREAERGQFVLALDEHPLAYTAAHGQSLDWLETA